LHGEEALSQRQPAAASDDTARGGLQRFDRIDAR
jgi:hypothetical protein